LLLYDGEMQIFWSSCKLFIWLFRVKGFLFRHKDVAILWCFYVGRGWTPRDELYGIVDQSIDPDLSLHEPIDISELSTFDVKVCMIHIAYNTDCFSFDGKIQILWNSYKLFILFLGVKGFLRHHKDAAILWCFYVGRGWTPRDELYGIVDQSIDPGLSLHEPIDIPELSTFDAKVWMIPIVYSTNCFSVTGRNWFFEVLANCSFSFWGWRDSWFTVSWPYVC